DGVVVANEMPPLAMRRRIGGDRRTVPFEPPGDRRQQPGHDAQEARLAAAVGTGEDERIARRQREGEAGENGAVAAAAGELKPGKARRPAHSAEAKKTAAPREGASEPPSWVWGANP